MVEFCYVLRFSGPELYAVCGQNLPGADEHGAAPLSIELQVGSPLHVDVRVTPRARPSDGLADVLHDTRLCRELMRDGDQHRPFAQPLDDFGERGE